MSTVDESLSALLILLAVAFFLAVYVWVALALGAMLRKMGDEPWQAWVPVLNIAALLRWGSFSPWLALLALVPGIGAVAVWVLLVVSAHRIGPGFGFDGRMTVLAAVLLPVWASILGFGPARWLGARHAGRIPSAGVRRAGPVGREGRGGSAPRHELAPDLFGPPESAAVPVSAPWVAPDLASEPVTTAPAAAPGPAPVAPADPAPVVEPAPAPAPVDPVPAAAVPVDPAPAATAPVDPASAATAPVDPAPAASAPAVAPAVPAADDGEIDDVSAIVRSPYPPSSAARSPFVAPLVDAGEPISDAPVRRSAVAADAGGAPVTRLPAGAARPDRPSRASEDPDAFPEMSGEVSAVVGSPAAGAPLSARRSVPARVDPDRAEEDGDLDQTIVARRRLPAWRLVPASGPAVDLTSETVILGRQPARDPDRPRAQLVRLEDPTRTVSKTHARLELHADGWYVTDLHSTNGVLLPTLLGTAAELEPGRAVPVGDRFLLGDAEMRLDRGGR